jgi:hypothetical protein
LAKRRKSQSIKSVIKNYGLMWRRDSVHWGRGHSKGTLEGRRSGQVVDFRDQSGVYVLYDEARRLIYVGQAGQGHARLFKRLQAHTHDYLAHRWEYFSWFGLLKVTKPGGLSALDHKSKRLTGTIGSTLNEIEGVLIAATEPPFNKQGARFRGISRYRQKPVERISLTTLRKILTKMDRKLDGMRGNQG